MKMIFSLFLSLGLSLIQAGNLVPECDPATLAAQARSVESSQSNEQLANRVMNIKRVSTEVLTHPLYGPELLKWIEMARWMESEEGRLVADLYIKTINDWELNKARLIAQDYQEQIKPELIFIPDRKLASISAAAKIQILNTTSPLESVLDLDLTELFKKVIQQVEFQRGTPSHCPPHFAELLLKRFHYSSVDFVKPRNMIAAIALREDLSLMKRKNAIANEKLAASFRNQAEFRRYLEKVYIGSKALKNLRENLIGKLIIDFQNRILTKMLSAYDLEIELDLVLDHHMEFYEIELSERSKLKGLLKVYLKAAFDGFFPQKYQPTSVEDLFLHQRSILAHHGKLVVELYIRSQALVESEARISPDQNPLSTALLLGAKSGTRAERIANYQRTEREATLRDLENRLRKPEISKIESVFVVQKLKEYEIPEEQLEQKIALRTITFHRAEAILEFYERLTDIDKLHFRKALGQLLNEECRRFSVVRDGEVKKMVTTDILELKVLGGSGKIRVNFGKDPVRGPMLIEAYYKQSDGEQAVRLESSVKAWKKY